MKRKYWFVMFNILLAVLLAACVAQPAIKPTTAGSPSPNATAEPDITLDDFIPVLGEVLEVGQGTVLIDDLVSGGKVTLLLDDSTRYPDKEMLEIKVGYLLSGDTATGWMKSLPPQAVLKYITACVPAVPVTGKVLEVGEDRILVEVAEGDQRALLISGDTFLPEGIKASIKVGGTLTGYHAEEVMESWPVQTRLLAVKSFQ